MFPPSLVNDAQRSQVTNSHVLRPLAAAILALLLLGWQPLSAQTINGINWFPIGPADLSNGQTYDDGRVNVSGRATVIAVNPTNPDDIWLGTATGGVWHSTNGGLNWLPMSDNEASLSIGALALDDCSPQGCARIYAGTGENNIRRDTYYGMGLLIGQLSGGEIPIFGWTLKGAVPFKFASINNVLVDDSGRTIYVSLSSGVTASATESTVTAPAPSGGFGIYKSSDSGNAWAKLTVPGTNAARPTDLERDPTNHSVMFAGFMGRGIFKTTDGGATWCPLNPGIPLPAGCSTPSGLPNPTTTTFDHVEIAIHRPNAATPAVLYAIFGNCPDPIGNGPVLGGACAPAIFKSTDDGAHWTQTNPAAPSSYSRYTHALAIDPTNPSTILFGGLKLARSTNSGTTFTGLGSNVHPDHHAIVFPDPANSNRLYNTSDGGFAFSNDGGVSWTSGNSDLQITGFQSISSSPLTARIIGGTQDNGTELWVGTRVWEHRDDGDSASTVMDLDDVMRMFDVYFGVSPRRSTDGGSCCGWSFIQTGLNTSDPSSFYAPLIEEPSTPHALYFGTNLLYKTTNKGNNWTAVSPVLGGTVFFPDINRSNSITAIAVAPSNANRIYVGYYDGQVFVTDSACTTLACWRAIGGTPRGLPSAPVTRIAVDPSNADVVYATFSGFGSGAHLFKSVNGGNSWSASASGLPAIPANTVSIETSSTLWAGTDDGVYKSTNSGGSWARFGFGLPHVPVYEITIDRVRGRLYAGTHGRGVYILTQPFLSNFEGWVAGDIWDIPVYGTGFVGSLATPVGSPCTMQIIQRSGLVCSSSTVDVQGGTISFDSSGQLVTSRGGFWNGRPVAWACYNGACIGGRTIAACNPPSNPITSVVVSCGAQVGIDHILGCPAQANPPSSILGLSGMPGGPGPAAPAAPTVATDAITAPTVFDLIPTIQGRDGTRALCSARVTLQPGDTPAQALVKARDAVNADPGCIQNSVTAVVGGIPPGVPLGEDLFSSPATLSIRAPLAVGGQLFTSLRAAPGAATQTCFDVSNLGSPLQNQVAVMKVEFDTSTGGASGGEVSVVERSPLGSCTVRVRTDPGESAAQIAAAIAAAFQAPGVPGPGQCPAIQNPRDITVDGSSIISVLASELRVCNSDRDVGFFLAPKELPNVRHLALQYAAKFVCGEQESKGGYSYPQAVASGHYYTTLNIHNPTDKTVTLRYKFATVLPNGQPGPISPFYNRKLGPDEALSIDCSEMMLFLNKKEELVDAFVVVESETDLDVAAVYSAAGKGRKVESFKVERIPPRIP